MSNFFVFCLICSFVHHKGKYRLVPLEQRLKKEKEYNAIDFELKSNKASEMPKALVDLMKEFVSLDIYYNSEFELYFIV